MNEERNSVNSLTTKNNSPSAKERERCQKLTKVSNSRMSTRSCCRSGGFRRLTPIARTCRVASEMKPSRPQRRSALARVVTEHHTVVNPEHKTVRKNCCFMLFPCVLDTAAMGYALTSPEPPRDGVAKNWHSRLQDHPVSMTLDSGRSVPVKR